MTILTHIFQTIMSKPLSILILMVYAFIGTYVLDIIVKQISKHFYHRKWRKIGNSNVNKKQFS
jgi:hypothetical protein